MPRSSQASYIHPNGRLEAYNGVSVSAAASHITVYISPNGDDSSGDGSSTKPFFSPTRARCCARRTSKGIITSVATVILYGGVYHLGHLPTLQLEEADSNVHWMADPGSYEQPVLSGAVALGDLTWTNYSGHERILVAVLPTNTPSISTLFDESTCRRLIRARHPNGDPELPSGMCFAYGGNKSLEKVAQDLFIHKERSRTRGLLAKPSNNASSTQPGVARYQAMMYIERTM